MSELTFKQSMERLEFIVRSLENNDIELEEAIKLFEEGLHLVKDADKTLTQFDTKIAELIKQFEEKKDE